MSIFASISVVNISRLRSSSLSFPLNDSIYPFSQGLPGSTKSVVTSRSFNHLRTAFAVNSGPKDREVITITEPTKIHGNVFSTGELEGIEQSMAVKTGKGLVLIVGCSHPYMGHILDAARKFGKIYGIIGGMHGQIYRTYLEPGRYLLTLTVYDRWGWKDSVTRQVEIPIEISKSIWKPTAYKKSIHPTPIQRPMNPESTPNSSPIRRPCSLQQS